MVECDPREAVKVQEIAREIEGKEDMKDWLERMWKSGRNPRVECPFLPHGLEEKLGVSYV